MRICLSIKRFSISRVIRCKSTSAKYSPAYYCLELVRKHDYENYLCTLLLPQNVTSSVLAIRAFNVEVAQVQDQVQDNKIGMMRLQFWREALNGIYENSPPRNPVSLELHRVLKKQPLSKLYFKRLIDARSQMLTAPMFMDLQSLETYSEYAVSSVYYLIVQAFGIKDVNVDHAASHLGKAHGLITLLRSVAYNAQNRINVLPQDILLKHGVATESIFQMQMSPGLRDTVYEVASCAKIHLDMATRLNEKFEKKVKLIFLPTLCIERYLEELRRVDFHIFQPALQRRDNFLPVRLLWKKFFIK